MGASESAGSRSSQGATQHTTGRRPGRPPAGPRLVEAGGYDVVHFPTQVGESTELPSIYQPWDLQHLHFPQYFSADLLAFRDAVWRTCAERATYVLVVSQFVRDDVVNAFAIDPSRVAVVSPGAPTSLRDTDVGARVPGVEEPFALYPAQAWEHKNHVRLLEAVALLEQRGLSVPLVCPGQPNERLRAVRRRAAELGVESLVRFPGYVTDGQLATLYRTARCLVFPSLFEGFGLPVLEAFVAGLPVACSSTSAVGELAGGAAATFDPTDVEAIAEALSGVWSDDTTRAALVEAGHARAEGYSWDRLARGCRRAYRAAVGETVTAADAALLAAAGVGVGSGD